MSAKLSDYFNKQPRIGTLSTSSRDGKVDVAVLGSPQMIDEKTVVMGLGRNRTLANLQENPNAVYIIMEPGKSVVDWKGLRVYLKVKEISTSGKLLDDFKAQIAKFVGEAASKMIYAAVSLEVVDARPIIDMGQGWESSI